MSVFQTTILHVVSAVACLGLGALVLVRNPYKRAHRAFAALALNLGLWTLGVVFIVHAREPGWVLFWLRLTFVIASFIPASYHCFLCVFPGHRFEGSRLLLVILLLLAVASSIGAFTPYYVAPSQLRVSPDAPPGVTYGPVFLILLASIALTMLYGFPLLFRKLWSSSGLERRQIQHVLLGTAAFTTLATVTNVVCPALGFEDTEAYGPVFLVLMMGTFAYAMVRYHLLDIWFILSRTTVYAILTAAVALIFVSTIFLVHWAFSNGSGRLSAGPTLLAALVIAVVLEPLKEHAQLLLERTVLKRRYDVHALLRRVSRSANHTVQLDELLEQVGQDIQETVGARSVRIMLVSETEPNVLITEYSTEPVEKETVLKDYGELLHYMRHRNSPVALEEMIHSRPTPEHARVAHHLAELGAYLCVPLRSMTDLIGLLTLGQKRTQDIYSGEDMAVFATLAGPLSTSIENARLYRKLEEANLHRARILASMRGGVLAVDTNGRVQTVNQAASEFVGDVGPGYALAALPKQIAEVLERTLATGCDLEDYETYLRRPDGQETPVAMSASCLTSTDGALKGAMVMIYDLSTVKRLEQNVQRADRLSSLGTLAAGMAHEIKNPLVSVKTFTQLLPTRYTDAEFRTTFTDVVLSAVERIDSIVSRLLDFARPRPATFAPRNICKIVQDVLMLAENQAFKAGINVESRFSEPESFVNCDEQQLHQVFLNLILNAVEAMGQTGGGKLRISTVHGRMRLRQGWHRPVQDVESVVVSVQDTGRGIPEDQLEVIFNPFHTTKEHGSGLGLSVVHGIVAEHGGTISVDSVPGQGATFSVAFPLVRQMASLQGGK